MDIGKDNRKANIKKADFIRTTWGNWLKNIYFIPKIKNKTIKYQQNHLLT